MARARRGLDGVTLHAGGVHVEGEARAVIVVRVDHDAEPIRIHQRHVAAAEPGLEGATIVESDADVDRLGVVEHPRLGPLAGGRTLLRIDLDELVDDGGAGPRRLVQEPVDPNRARCADRVVHGAGGDVRVVFSGLL